MNTIQQSALYTKFTFTELKNQISTIIGCDIEELDEVGGTGNELIRWFDEYIPMNAKVSLQIINGKNVSIYHSSRNDCVAEFAVVVKLFVE
jgi:hypothetical protein